MTIALRAAQPNDVPFLVSVVTHPAIAPFLAAVRASDEETVGTEVLRALDEPEAFGVLVIESGGSPVGTVAWRRVNRRSRIAEVSGLALLPEARGTGAATTSLELLVAELLGERGFHRVQLEVYGFNDRAAALFERAGFTREGVRRRAYWRDGDWVDGILFGLVAEDRQSPPA
jgi:aminoglycoside 6'-N-acetyltransferase